MRERIREASKALDPAGGLIQNICDSVRGFGGKSFRHRTIAQDGVKIAHRAANRRTFGPFALITHRLEPRNDARDFFGLFGKLRATRLGCGKGLSRTSFSFLDDQAFIDQQRERGINDTGTWRIFTARQIAHRPDQVIAVARLLADKVEQKQAQFAACEHARTASALVTAPATHSATTTKWPASAEGTPFTKGTTTSKRAVATEAPGDHGRQFCSTPICSLAAARMTAMSELHVLFLFDGSKIYL